MRVVNVLFWVLIIALATLFYALNIDNGVELKFHFWRSPPTIPVSIVVTVALVIGVVISALIGLIEHRKLKKKKRFDSISPLQATRMGPAIRHATAKLERQETRTKILFLISDGRPQDHGYGRDSMEKEYAIHDTKMALLEAKQRSIVPFCLTVDRAGHDYLKTMCSDLKYAVVSNIHSLPRRLPALYRGLTT